MSQLQKKSPGFVSRKDGFNKLETKHYKRTAPRPKLFVLVGRLQELKATNQKTVLGSSLGEGVGFRDYNILLYYLTMHTVCSDL
jgi:hypothetical protein